jgi:cation diffusion facilitator family transporter
MHDLKRWQHEHVFRQDQAKAGEKRTLLVAVLTAAMMLVEIVVGLVYGSMALLADGLHMTSHATALGIAVLAYVLARRYAADSRFTFGTGKVSSLAGFASAVLLLGFAIIMVTESTDRLINPVVISFTQAIVVAVIGLVVNGISA